MKLLRKIKNLLLWGKWTDCKHEDIEPVGFADWKCKGCGAET